MGCGATELQKSDIDYLTIFYIINQYKVHYFEMTYQMNLKAAF